MSETWTRGYDLDKLRAYTYPFKARHAPLVFGAFGLVRERDVAYAMSCGSFLHVSDGDEVGASAIFKSLTRPGSPTDFTGAVVPLPPGPRVYVSAFAALNKTAAAQLLIGLCAKAGGRPMFVELFEEDEIAKSALFAARYRYLASKVSAGGEVKGIYVAPWVYTEPRAYAPEEEATLLVLDDGFLSAEVCDAIFREVQNSAEWQQHYSSYNKRKSWTSFALRGYSNDPSFIIKPAEMSKSWKENYAALLEEKPRDTSIACLFPNTMYVVSRIAPRCELDRVRFMRLAEEKGELTRHADITDREAGVADGKISRLHIPIRTHPDVRFAGWDHRGRKIVKHLPERALCYLDQRKPHAVVNSSPQERIHLVVDVRTDEALREKIRVAAGRQ